MNFIDNPKLFINDYYNDKKNIIDFNCESLISKSEDQTEIVKLNELRMTFIDRLELIKQTVLQRYDSLQSKYNTEMLREHTQQIKDEIFLDKYCYIISVNYQFPVFELQLGLLLISEFDNHLLDDLKYIVNFQK